MGLTCTAVLLMQTPLLDGVCCCLLPEGLAVLVGERILAWSVSTPVGKEMSVIWSFLSVGDTKLHGLLRGSLLLLPLIVDGRNASKALSKWDAGRLISARSELTLSKQGDLELCKDHCTCFGVMVVLVGFSLEMAVCIVIPMAEYCLWIDMY